jgi:glycosyltransferase involved in cell wall biosynthesis
MRVLLWGELFWPYVGGAELFAARLMLSLRERGYDFAVMTSHDNLSLPDEDTYRGIPVYRFPFRTVITPERLDEITDLRQRVGGLVRELAPRVIHLNGVSPSAFFCLPAVRSAATPLLVRLNRQLMPSVARAGTLFENALQAAAWVVGVSNAVLEPARHFMPDIRTRSSLIYNGVDASADPPAPPPCTPPVILALGRLVHDKGFDLAIAAFAEVARRRPDARLRIGGDGLERAALEQQAAALGIAARVEFLGWIAPDAVSRVIAGATMLVLPSRSEGLPAVALEAAALGRPVVATPAGGLQEAVEDGRTGLLVRPDAGAFGEAISHLLNEPETIARMGEAAWQRACRLFGHQRCVDDYDRLYRRLAAAEG